MIQDIIRVWSPIFLAMAVLAGWLYSLLKSPSYGLYTGPVDDGFLVYFGGGEYTAFEFVRHVEMMTEGSIQLKKEAVQVWFDGATRRGVLKTRRVKKSAGKGYYQTDAYSLSETAP